jgi:hypothetical protein
LLHKVEEIGEIVPNEPAEFFRETNVIPIEIRGVRVDLVAADLPFEREAIDRSRSIDFFGIELMVCTPEDLVIQKAVSTREKDWADIQYILENRGQKMDWDYLLKHCKELALFLDAPEIYRRVKEWKDE